MFPIHAIFFVVVALFVYLCFALTHWRRQKLVDSLIHGLSSKWGQTFAIDQKYVRKLGQLFGTYDLTTPVLVVAKPELIHRLLVKESDAFSERQRCPKGEVAFTNSALFSRKTDTFKHEIHLRVINKALSSSKNMVEVCKHCMKFDHELLQMIGRIISVENYLDFVQILNIFLVKKYVNMCFGISIDQKIKTQILKYFEYVVKTPDSESDAEPPQPWFVSNFFAYVLGKTTIEQKIWQQIRVLVEDIYAKREKGGCNNSLLYMISDADEDSDLTKDHYIDNALLFSIMGFKSSAAIVANLIYHLSHNQSAQNKLIKEIDEYVKNQEKTQATDFMCPKKEAVKLPGQDPNETKEGQQVQEEIKTDEEATGAEAHEEEEDTEEMEQKRQEYLNSINELPYLDACIKEILRLYPPIPRLTRKATKDINIDGIKVTKGIEVVIPIYTVQRDKENFPNPEVFKPERFCGKDGQNVRPGTYMPFGDGPRNCAGNRLAMIAVKICIINIFNTYRLVKTNLTKDLKFHSNDFLFSSMMPNSVVVKVVQRNKSVLE